MQFSAIALLAATVAASTTVDLSVAYQVSDFQASCVPHSGQCNYTFGVMVPNSMDQSPIRCTGSGLAGVGSTLPESAEGTCENSSRTFKVVRNAGGLSISVSAPVSPISNTVGTYEIPASDLARTVDEVNPNGSVEFYKGPKNFDLKRVD
ncbi:hypothetical protein MN608_11371 [Microdochium nivale]|nr:hypothetical protein MN608_11371 [Microdochium nivale]